MWREVLEPQVSSGKSPVSCMGCPHPYPAPSLAHGLGVAEDEAVGPIVAVLPTAGDLKATFPQGDSSRDRLLQVCVLRLPQEEARDRASPRSGPESTGQLEAGRVIMDCLLVGYCPAAPVLNPDGRPAAASRRRLGRR